MDNTNHATARTVQNDADPFAEIEVSIPWPTGHGCMTKRKCSETLECSVTLGWSVAHLWAETRGCAAMRGYVKDTLRPDFIDDV